MPEFFTLLRRNVRLVQIPFVSKQPAASAMVQAFKAGDVNRLRRALSILLRLPGRTAAVYSILCEQTSEGPRWVLLHNAPGWLTVAFAGFDAGVLHCRLDAEKRKWKSTPVGSQVWRSKDGDYSGPRFIETMVQAGRFRNHDYGHTALAISRVGDEIVTGLALVYIRVK